MKKFNKILSLILCLSTILSAFIAIPAGAEDSIEFREVVNEDFESMSVGQNPSGKEWSFTGVGDISPANVEDAPTVAPLDKALHLNHIQIVRNISAVREIERTSYLNFSVDYMYDSMSPTDSSKGGAYFNFYDNGNCNLYIAAVKSTKTDDTAKFVVKKDGTLSDISFPEGSFTINKGEWYRIEISVTRRKTSGSCVDFIVKQGGETLAKTTINVNATLTIDKFSFCNAGTDPNDSHWLDNLSIRTGKSIYETSFEEMATGEMLNTDGWSVTCPDGYNPAQNYIKPERSPNKGEDFAARGKAMHHNHFLADGEYVTNLVVARSFDAADTFKLSFDYLYESLSAVDSSKGGSYFQLYNESTNVFYLAVVKNSDGDNTAKLVCKKDGSTADLGFVLNRNEWYKINIEASPRSGGGSNLRITVEKDGVAEFIGVYTLKSKLTVTKMNFCNAGGDPYDSFWLDNFILEAGDYVYRNDFENDETGMSAAEDGWTLSCNGAYDESKIYSKVGYAPLGVTYVREDNKIMRLKHYGTGANNISTSLKFPSTTGVSFDFDLLYESLSPARSDGGLYIAFYNGSTAVQTISVLKNSTSDDNTAKIQYKKGSTNTVAYDKLVKGQWYNVELYVGKNADGSSRVELKISRGDEVLLDEKYWCPQSVTIDEIRISNGSSRDDADSYCFDNISVSTDHGYNYTEDFENCTEGSSLSEYGWNITCSWGSYNNDDVHVRVAECDVSVRKEAEKVENSNKALYIEDMSNTTYPRAYRSFEPAKSVIAEFDFMLVSDTDYCAAIIGLGDSSIGPKASRGWLAVYPNKDANGNYLGSGNLQYYNGSAYVKTSVTSMMAGTWYNIRLEALAGKNTVAVYVDGAKILDIPVTAKYTEMDRIGFMAGGSDNIGDKFFIDNLVVNTPKPIPATEFEDNLWGLSELPADYTASGEVSLVDGEITLAGVASVNRSFTGVTESGEFSFSIKTSSLEKAAHIAITYDGADKFDLRVREDGALEYRRPTPWEDTWLVVNTMLPAEDGTKYPKQAITAGEWADITLRLAYDRNNNYVMVYVDGEYVGNALYAQSFNNVNGIKVSSVNADATVITKNFKFAFDTTGVFKMPERNQEDAVSYLPLVIEGSRAMYLEGDSKPASGAMSYADGATSIQFNKQYSSMGVDLGEKQRVNALRITTEAPDEATMTSLSSLSYKVYISDDNITYTQIMGRVYNHFLENGKWTALVEFSGIEARYVKLTYSSSTGADNPIIVYPQGNIRPEAKIARQYKMAGDFIEADGIDAEPLCTPMLRNYNTAEGITLTKSMSVGLNMGIVCPVEAVELVGTGLSGLDKNAFKVYVSNDNCVYAPIDDVILSRDTRDGKDVYRLSFDSVDCIYIKLNVVADGVNVELDTRKDGFAAYSSKEADSKLVQYASVRSGEGDFYTLPDGTIVMLYIGFTQAGDGHDYSNYLVLAKASTDGGATWGEPWIFVALPPEALSVSMAKVFHVEGEPGHMRMVYRLIITRDDGKGYTCEYYFVESFDYGRNWENPQPVIHDIYPDTFGGGSSGNQITRLSNGRILYSNSLYKYQNDDYGGAQTFRQFISGYVYYSDDEGKTWTRSDSTIIMPANCDETSIAELPNGDLLLTLRTRDVNGVHQSISTDNGVTWSQPVAVEGMDSPSSTNTVVTIPATGDVLLIWNNEVWNPANTGGNGIRIPLTMSVTADHGLTYHNYRNLYENSQSWPLIYFYGRNLFVQSSSRNSTMDVALLYHTIDGTKTVADLPKAATPSATYAGGVLSGVTSTMTYSTDGGNTWRFCGGSSVELGEVDSILVKDVGTYEYAPSEIQTVR